MFCRSFISALNLANRLLSLSRRPCLRNIYGVTQNNVATAAMMLVAIFEPSPEYIWYANKGMQPDNVPRRKATAAKPEDA
jgi:hypothetical protein